MLSTRTLVMTFLGLLAVGASLSAGPVDFGIGDASLPSTWNAAALLGIAAFAVGLSRRRLRRLRRSTRGAHP
ncbi:MAG TPA: hypothetical protein VFE31_04350 [Opitutaceae bacterium]|jgi:hypothetical protein|nr:hypothetical protein [Opitutaceae bacterium]